MEKTMTSQLQQTKPAEAEPGSHCRLCFEGLSYPAFYHCHIMSCHFQCSQLFLSSRWCHRLVHVGQYRKITKSKSQAEMVMCVCWLWVGEICQDVVCWSEKRKRKIWPSFLNLSFVRKTTSRRLLIKIPFCPQNWSRSSRTCQGLARLPV